MSRIPAPRGTLTTRSSCKRPRRRETLLADVEHVAGGNGHDQKNADDRITDDDERMPRATGSATGGNSTLSGSSASRGLRGRCSPALRPFGGSPGQLRWPPAPTKADNDRQRRARFGAVERGASAPLAAGPVRWRHLTVGGHGARSAFAKGGGFPRSPLLGLRGRRFGRSRSPSGWPAARGGVGRKRDAARSLPSGGGPKSVTAEYPVW